MPDRSPSLLRQSRVTPDIPSRGLWRSSALIAAIAVISAIACLVFSVFQFTDASSELEAAETAAKHIDLIRAETGAAAAISRLRATAVLHMYTGDQARALERDALAYGTALEASVASLSPVAAHGSKDPSDDSALMADALRDLMQSPREIPPAANALEASDEFYRSINDIVFSPPSEAWADLLEVPYTFAWAMTSPWDHFEVLVAHHATSSATTPTDSHLSSLIDAHMAGQRQIAIEVGDDVDQETWFDRLLNAEDGRNEPFMAGQLERLSAHKESQRMDRELVGMLKGEQIWGPEETIKDRYQQLSSFSSALSEMLEEVLSHYGDRARSTVAAQTRRRNQAAATAAGTVLATMAFLFWLGTRRRRRNEEYRRLAEVDSLTGLSNRLALHRYEPSRLLDPGQAGFAVLQLDIDRFKRINDEYGHAVGDAVLVAFASRLRAVVRATADTVARVGGDEFAIVLHHLVDIERQSREVAERIEELLQDPIDCAGRPLRLHASIGIATSAEAVGLESLLDEADLALYRAKERRQGEQRDTSDERNQLLARTIPGAIARGEIDCLFAPQIDYGNGRTAGLEVSIRCGSSAAQDLCSDSVLQVVEWLGESRTLLEHLAPQLHEAHEHVGRSFDGRFWIHVPQSILVGTTAAQRFVDTMTAAGVPLARVGILIRESLPDRAMEDVQVTLSALHGQSVGVGVSNFGAGSMPMKWLTTLPLERVVLSKCLVQDLNENAPNRTLVRATHSVCVREDLSLVAKGVSTDLEASALASIGVRVMQGPSVARPLELSALRRVLDGVRLPAFETDPGTAGGPLTTEGTDASESGELPPSTLPTN